MFYANYNKDTKELLGWYNDEIHETIPEPNIELTEEDWQIAIESNANFVDIKNSKVILKDLRSDEDKLFHAKALKKNEYIENKALVIEENTFSTSREDILKYKEATDIRKTAGELTVDLYVAEGKKEFTIEAAEDIIKQLSEKAYADFWLKKDFEDLVDTCTTVEEVEAIVIPTV